MASVIKHALHAAATSNRSDDAPGWNPTLRVTLLGPSPAAELVATWRTPAGADWVEHRTDAPELGDGELATLDLGRWRDGDDVAEAGDATFVLRLESELDGIDEVLHEGVLRVVAVGEEAEHRYAAEIDGYMSFALVGLDTVSDTDGPPLRVSVFVKGAENDSWAMEAHLFRDGKRIAQATAVTSGHEFTASDGRPRGREVIAEFGTVRGWNTLAHQGWGEDDWTILDAGPAAYEVKVTRGGKKVARVVPFAVGEDGLIVKAARLELDPAGRAVIWADATVGGDLDGPLSGDAPGPGHGDLATAAIDWPIASMYALRAVPEPVDPDALDEATAAALASLAETASDLLRTWEAEVTPDVVDQGSMQSQFLLQCEFAVVPAADRWAAARAELSAVPGEQAVTLLDVPATLAEAEARVLALGANARRHLAAR